MTTPIIAPRLRIAPRTGLGPRTPVSVGLIAAAISFAFNWVPSLWFDEAATVVSARRSWAALWREIHTVDAVHAVYYALMHVWFDLVGYSPLTLRLPPALAIGVAGGLLVALGRMLVDTRFGVIAGLLFAVLPRVTFMGGEGRTYAAATALGVGATILFLGARQRMLDGRPSSRWWIGYLVLTTFNGAIFGYLLLVALGHAVTAVLPLLRREDRGSAAGRTAKRVLLMWAASIGLALLVLRPLLRLVMRESKQVAWIPHLSGATVGDVAVTQWFTGNAAFSVLAWTLIVAGIVTGLLWRRRMRPVLAVALPWMAVPTVLLILASLAHPLYSPRYVSYAAPGAALMMAVPLSALLTAERLRHARAYVVGAVVLAALVSAPSWVAQRQVAAKDDSAWNQVAAVVAAGRAAEPRDSSDVVLYGPLQRHPAATSRIIEESYPHAFAGMRDITLETPAYESRGLWETQRPLASVLNETDTASDIWLLTAVKPDERSVVTAELAPRGFRIAHEWRRTRTWIVEYDRRLSS